MPSVTALALLGLSGLHAVWGCGSTVPFRTAEDLADAVVGRRAAAGAGDAAAPSGLPPSAACFAVAGALATAASLVADRPAWPPRLRRLGLAVLATTLGTRGAVGLVGRTDLLSPGSTSERFRRNDRHLFAPLCVALAAGSVAAVRP